MTTALPLCLRYVACLCSRAVVTSQCAALVPSASCSHPRGFVILDPFDSPRSPPCSQRLHSFVSLGGVLTAYYKIQEPKKSSKKDKSGGGQMQQLSQGVMEGGGGSAGAEDDFFTYNTAVQSVVMNGLDGPLDGAAFRVAFAAVASNPFLKFRGTELMDDAKDLGLLVKRKPTDFTLSLYSGKASDAQPPPGAMERLDSRGHWISYDGESRGMPPWTHPNELRRFACALGSLNGVLVDKAWVDPHASRHDALQATAGQVQQTLSSGKAIAPQQQMAVAGSSGAKATPFASLPSADGKAIIYDVAAYFPELCGPNAAPDGGQGAQRMWPGFYNPSAAGHPSALARASIVKNCVNKHSQIAAIRRANGGAGVHGDADAKGMPLLDDEDEELNSLDVAMIAGGGKSNSRLSGQVNAVLNRQNQQQLTVASMLISTDNAVEPGSNPKAVVDKRLPTIPEEQPKASKKGTKDEPKQKAGPVVERRPDNCVDHVDPVGDAALPPSEWVVRRGFGFVKRAEEIGDAWLAKARARAPAVAGHISGSFGAPGPKQAQPGQDKEEGAIDHAEPLLRAGAAGGGGGVNGVVNVNAIAHAPGNVNGNGDAKGEADELLTQAPAGHVTVRSFFEAVSLAVYARHTDDVKAMIPPFTLQQAVIELLKTLPPSTPITSKSTRPPFEEGQPKPEYTFEQPLTLAQSLAADYGGDGSAGTTARLASDLATQIGDGGPFKGARTPIPLTLMHLTAYQVKMKVALFIPMYQAHGAHQLVYQRVLESTPVHRPDGPADIEGMRRARFGCIPPNAAAAVRLRAPLGWYEPPDANDAVNAVQGEADEQLLFPFNADAPFGVLLRKGGDPAKRVDMLVTHKALPQLRLLSVVKPAAHDVGPAAVVLQQQQQQQPGDQPVQLQQQRGSAVLLPASDQLAAAQASPLVAARQQAAEKALLRPEKESLLRALAAGGFTSIAKDIAHPLRAARKMWANAAKRQASLSPDGLCLKQMPAPPLGLHRISLGSFAVERPPEPAAAKAIQDVRGRRLLFSLLSAVVAQVGPVAVDGPVPVPPAGRAVVEPQPTDAHITALLQRAVATMRHKGPGMVVGPNGLTLGALLAQEIGIDGRSPEADLDAYCLTLEKQLSLATASDRVRFPTALLHVLAHVVQRPVELYEVRQRPRPGLVQSLAWSGRIAPWNADGCLQLTPGLSPIFLRIPRADARGLVFSAGALFGYVSEPPAAADNELVAPGGLVPANQPLPAAPGDAQLTEAQLKANDAERQVATMEFDAELKLKGQAKKPRAVGGNRQSAALGGQCMTNLPLGGIDLATQHAYDVLHPNQVVVARAELAAFKAGTGAERKAEARRAVRHQRALAQRRSLKDLQPQVRPQQQVAAEGQAGASDADVLRDVIASAAAANAGKQRRTDDVFAEEHAKAALAQGTLEKGVAAAPQPSALPSQIALDISLFEAVAAALRASGGGVKAPKRLEGEADVGLSAADAAAATGTMLRQRVPAALRKWKIGHFISPTAVLRYSIAVDFGISPAEVTEAHKQALIDDLGVALPIDQPAAGNQLQQVQVGADGRTAGDATLTAKVVPALHIRMRTTYVLALAYVTARPILIYEPSIPPMAAVAAANGAVGNAPPQGALALPAAVEEGNAPGVATKFHYRLVSHALPYDKHGCLRGHADAARMPLLIRAPLDTSNGHPVDADITYGALLPLAPLPPVIPLDYIKARMIASSEVLPQAPTAEQLRTVATAAVTAAGGADLNAAEEQDQAAYEVQLLRQRAAGPAKVCPRPSRLNAQLQLLRQVKADEAAARKKACFAIADDRESVEGGKHELSRLARIDVARWGSDVKVVPNHDLFPVNPATPPAMGPMGHTGKHAHPHLDRMVGSKATPPTALVHEVSQRVNDADAKGPKPGDASTHEGTLRGQADWRTALSLFGALAILDGTHTPWEIRERFMIEAATRPLNAIVAQRRLFGAHSEALKDYDQATQLLTLEQLLATELGKAPDATVTNAERELWLQRQYKGIGKPPSGETIMAIMATPLRRSLLVFVPRIGIRGIGLLPGNDNGGAAAAGNINNGAGAAGNNVQADAEADAEAEAELQRLEREHAEGSISYESLMAQQVALRPDERAGGLYIEDELIARYWPFEKDCAMELKRRRGAALVHSCGVHDADACTFDALFLGNGAYEVSMRMFEATMARAEDRFSEDGPGTVPLSLIGDLPELRQLSSTKPGERGFRFRRQPPAFPPQQRVLSKYWADEWGWGVMVRGSKHHPLAAATPLQQQVNSLFESVAAVLHSLPGQSLGPDGGSELRMRVINFLNKASMGFDGTDIDSQVRAGLTLRAAVKAPADLRSFTGGSSPEIKLSETRHLATALTRMESVDQLRANIDALGGVLGKATPDPKQTSIFSLTFGLWAQLLANNLRTTIAVYAPAKPMYVGRGEAAPGFELLHNFEPFDVHRKAFIHAVTKAEHEEELALLQQALADARTERDTAATIAEALERHQEDERLKFARSERDAAQQFVDLLERRIVALDGELAGQPPEPMPPLRVVYHMGKHFVHANELYVSSQPNGADATKCMHCVFEPLIVLGSQDKMNMLRREEDRPLTSAELAQEEQRKRGDGAAVMHRAHVGDSLAARGMLLAGSVDKYRGGMNDPALHLGNYWGEEDIDSDVLPEQPTAFTRRVAAAASEALWWEKCTQQERAAALARWEQQAKAESAQASKLKDEAALLRAKRKVEAMKRGDRAELEAILKQEAADRDATLLLAQQDSIIQKVDFRRLNEVLNGGAEGEMQIGQQAVSTVLAERNIRVSKLLTALPLSWQLARVARASEAGLFLNPFALQPEDFPEEISEFTAEQQAARELIMESWTPPGGEYVRNTMLNPVPSKVRGIYQKAMYREEYDDSLLVPVWQGESVDVEFINGAGPSRAAVADLLISANGNGNENGDRGGNRRGNNNNAPASVEAVRRALRRKPRTSADDRRLVAKLAWLDEQKRIEKQLAKGQLVAPRRKGLKKLLFKAAVAIGAKKKFAVDRPRAAVLHDVATFAGFDYFRNTPVRLGKAGGQCVTAATCRDEESDNPCWYMFETFDLRMGDAARLPLIPGGVHRIFKTIDANWEVNREEEFDGARVNIFGLFSFRLAPTMWKQGRHYAYYIARHVHTDFNALFYAVHGWDVRRSPQEMRGMVERYAAAVSLDSMIDESRTLADALEQTHYVSQKDEATWVVREADRQAWVTKLRAAPIGAKEDTKRPDGWTAADDYTVIQLLANQLQRPIIVLGSGKRQPDAGEKALGQSKPIAVYCMVRRFLPYNEAGCVTQQRGEAAETAPVVIHTTIACGDDVGVQAPYEAQRKARDGQTRLVIDAVITDSDGYERTERLLAVSRLRVPPALAAYIQQGVKAERRNVALWDFSREAWFNTPLEAPQPQPLLNRVRNGAVRAINGAARVVNNAANAAGQLIDRLRPGAAGRQQQAQAEADAGPLAQGQLPPEEREPIEAATIKRAVKWRAAGDRFSYNWRKVRIAIEAAVQGETRADVAARMGPSKQEIATGAHERFK